MKNKISAIFLSLALAAASVPALADSVTTLSFTLPANANKTETVLLASYNSNGFLLNIKMISNVTAVDNVATITLDEKIAGADTYKVIYPSTFTFVHDVTISEQDTDAAPTAEPTAKPVATPTAKPAATYPSVYPSHKDAVNALAIVTNVSVTLDENDEQITKIECLYQGSERILYIDKDITLPNGDSLTTLKKGDMIHFTAKLNGKINYVSLDYRPLSDDIISEHDDIGSFQTLLGAASSTKYSDTLGREETGYVFGVIQDKGNSSFTLYNLDGLFENSVDLSFSDDTIVYTCDLEKKTELEISTPAAIRKSTIPKASYDEDDNITTWEHGTFVYALANVIEGEVVEVIIYTY